MIFCLMFVGGFFVLPNSVEAAITYNAGTNKITVVGDATCGDSIGNPCTFQHIYNADVAGGWGVFHKQEESYFCEAHLQIAANSYFVDSGVSLQLGTSGSRLNLTTAAGSYFELKSFSLTHHILTWPNWQYGEMVFENGFLYLRSTGYIFKYKATLKNLYIDTASSDLTFYYTLVSGEVDNVIFDGFSIGIRASFPINKLTVKDATYGIVVFHYPVHPIAKNVILTGNTNDIQLYHCTNPVGQSSITMLDSVFDKTKLLFGCADNYLLEKYSFDLKIIDKEESVIVGASVSIKDQYNNLVSYVDSEANLAEVLDKTETGVDVTDGTKFTVNDIILIDGEYMKVTNIASNTLTVTRNYYGANYFANIHPTSKDMFIVQALTTNASGQIPTQMGFRGRFDGTSETETTYSPHTLTITHQDYPSREFEFTLDEKIDWTLALKDKPLSEGTAKVLGTEYESSDATAAIYAQILQGDGSPGTSATVALTVYDRDGSVVTGFDGVSMTHIANGIYRYAMTTPVAEGTYAASVVASSPTAYGVGDFHIASWANKIAASSTIADAVWDEQRGGHTASGSFGEALQNIVPTALEIASSTWSYTGASLDTAGNAISKVWSFATRKLSSRQIADEAGEHIAQEENVASNVWSETQSGYAVSGTFGYYLNSRISAIASDVWNYTSSIGGDLIQNLGDIVWNSYSGVRKLTSRQIGDGGVYIPGVTESGTIAQIADKTTQDSIEYDVELVRKATFDFAGKADADSDTLHLVDEELNKYPDDHWNNYELIMMSGDNVGERRVVEDFVRSTYTITLTNAFDNAIAVNDEYVLSHEHSLIHKIWNWTGDIVSGVWNYTNTTGRTLTSLADVAGDIWDYGTRKLTHKELTEGGNLATELYIDTATSTIIAKINANEAKIDLIYADTQSILIKIGAHTDLVSADTLFGRANLLKEKWNTHTAAEIIGYVDEVETKLGAPGDLSSASTVFGRIKDIREKWGTQTGQTIFDKAKQAYDTIILVRADINYESSGTTVYDDIVLLKGYTDDLETLVGVPADLSSANTLFGRVKDVREKLDQLDILESKLDIVDGIVDALRASQQLDYTVELSDVGEVETTKTYRAKLSIWDYENNPANASTTPTITIYDASRATADTDSMTEFSTGVYEYTYIVPSNAVCGVWESVVSIDLGGATALTLNDYWEVEGSPAQVIINSMSDLTVPSISANVTISNEGNSGYEYQYEWCVVTSQDNQCGGGNDIDYASAAKYLNVGEDYTANLGLTVPNTGDYWFKVVVYYGTEASGASRTFTAAIEEEAPSTGTVIVSPGTAPVGPITNKKIYSKLLEMQNELGYHGTHRTAYKDLANTKYSLGILPNQVSDPLYTILAGVSSDIQAVRGDQGYNLDDLYSVSQTDSGDLKYIVNKTAELKAVIDVNKSLISTVANQPIIKTWFSEGSIVLNILVINPPDAASRIITVKEYLPEEIRSEHIIEIEQGLRLEYDSGLDNYFVSGEVKLGAGERKTFKIKTEDVFKISEDELNSLKEQSDTLMFPLAGTSYFAQAAILKSEIDANINGILRQQAGQPTNIEKRILIFRDNQKDLQKIKENIGSLKKIVSEVSGKGGVFGSLFGVSTTMTWAIIIIVVVGIAVLMIMLFSFLSRQRAMEYHISGGKRLKAPPIVDVKKQAIKIKGGFITYFLPPFGKPVVDLRQMIKMIKILIILGILVILVFLGIYYFQ